MTDFNSGSGRVQFNSSEGIIDSNRSCPITSRVRSGIGIKNESGSFSLRSVIVGNTISDSIGASNKWE